ncbi:amidohydrolase family protein [Streptomyces sp. SID3343]|uniref:amidohydrolase family protein n=1 Tax=Streptomyces sp. SID3343 TaxID=2690260 RepID=UPI00136F7AD9|nr:amidohydrolase family protein [Streptomyces sp. SID3343]MYW01897.1 amidohydrolase family protein [Streptomyces sp. SID3343]
MDSSIRIRVDAHVHVASADRARYPLAPSGVGSPWFRADDVGTLDLLAALDSGGVERAVVVQAVGAYGYDCAYAIDSVRAHPDRLALVGSVDMDAADPARALSVLAHEAGELLRGVRVFGVHGHDPRWLDDGRADDVWALAGDLGLNVVPVLFPAALGRLGAVVARHPDVPVALDHCGFVDLSDGAPFAAAGPLLDLAALPAVRVKVSSHVLELAAAAGDPADLVDRLAATFGAHRAAWGSDHPQTTGHTYPEMVALGRHSARRLAPADRESFLGGTALALWWPSA